MISTPQQAPVVRVTHMEAPAAYARGIEDHISPTPERVVEAVRRISG